MVLRPWLALAIFVTLAFSGTFTFAQGLGPDIDRQRAMNGIQDYRTTGSVIQVRVRGEDHKLFTQQALVTVANTSDKTNYYETTRDNSEAVVPGVTKGNCEIEVSAVGFISVHLTQAIAPIYRTYELEVVLKPDPSSINLNAALDAPLPPKIRKQVQRAVTYMKATDLKHAQKELEAAAKIEPENPETNFLLGFVFLQRKDSENARKYLEKSVAGDPHNVRALTMLGKVRWQEKDFANAKSLLQQALTVDPDFWNAHYLLADSLLRLKEYPAAREHAQLAIDKGKGAAGKAYLVLGEADAHLNQDEFAVEALRTYLRVNPESPFVGEVKSFIAWLEQRAQDRKKDPNAVSTTVLSRDDIEAADETDANRLAMRGWAPPGVDDLRPVVSQDTPCPAERVITQAGERVKELATNVSKFAAVEEVLHEDLDATGHPTKRENRRFDYSVEITENNGNIGVGEYRSTKGELSEFPEHIETRGFPALAMVFHPAKRDGFTMTCEGLGQWKNQATWLVYFRQRADRPNRMHEYVVYRKNFPADLKGRAWISAQTFQIVHIESELVAPVKTINLLTEHQIVDYGPVLFAARKEELWLPKNADIYMDFQRHRFHRSHSFDHFLLFAVDSDAKDKVPVVPAPDKPATPASKGPVQ